MLLRFNDCIYKPGATLDVYLWKLHYMCTGDIRIMREQFIVLHNTHYVHLPKLTCSAVLMGPYAGASGFNRKLLDGATL